MMKSRCEIEVPLGPGAVPLLSLVNDFRAITGLTVAISTGQLAGRFGNGSESGCLSGLSVLRCWMRVGE